MSVVRWFGPCRGEQFKKIAIAEGTPVGLFDWQAKNVFKALNEDLVEFGVSRIEPKEIPCAKKGETKRRGDLSGRGI